MAFGITNKTITSANATGVVTFGSDLFPVPVLLEGFSTDAAVELDDFKPVEGTMGVDGQMAFGYVPTPRVIKITFQANSPSLDLFAAVLDLQDTLGDVIRSDMVFALPALGRLYTGTNGAITSGKNMPSAKKKLEPVTIELTFESWVGVGV